MARSPRQRLLHQAASSTVNEETGPSLRVSKTSNLKQPLTLIMQIFRPLSSKNEDFWFRVVPFFTREEHKKGTVFWRQGEPSNAFYLIESGIILATYDLDNKQITESIVAGTVCGELPFLSETPRSATVTCERECVVWKMNQLAWQKMKQSEQGDAMAHELLIIGLKLTEERLNVFIQSSMVHV